MQYRVPSTERKALERSENKVWGLVAAGVGWLPPRLKIPGYPPPPLSLESSGWACFGGQNLDVKELMW